MIDTSISAISKDISDIESISAITSILDIACQVTGMGFSVVVRVTDDQWVACAVNDKIQFGLKPGGELKLETTLCNEVKQYSKVIAIDHVAEDPVYRNHHTPKMYGLQSYISVPIYTKQKGFFGTLCAIDPNPAKVNNDMIIKMFNHFAELIAFHLDVRYELQRSNEKLLKEQEIAELREQFIAILGHDLRNPVGAIDNISQMMATMKPDEAIVERMAKILNSATHRMKGLINNMMDFAQGRLGGGINLNPRMAESLDEVLLGVINELQTIWPDREIYTNINLQSIVYCDELRIAQLFSNLLSNALAHGKEDSPVLINIDSDATAFTVSVANEGNKIPDDMQQKLFEPFFRGGKENQKEGLGLGLFIASQIANAHGGSISVISNEQETSFTLSIPLGHHLRTEQMN